MTVAGSTSGGFNGDGDPAIISQLSNPFAVATDGAGNLFIADYSNHRIREVLASNSTMQTVVGNGTAGLQETVRRVAEVQRFVRLPAVTGRQRLASTFNNRSGRSYRSGPRKRRRPAHLHGSPEQYRPYGGQHHLRYDIDGAVGIYRTGPSHDQQQPNQHRHYSHDVRRAGGNGQVQVQGTVAAPTFLGTTSPVITVLPLRHRH